MGDERNVRFSRTFLYFVHEKTAFVRIFCRVRAGSSSKVRRAVVSVAANGGIKYPIFQEE